MDLQKITQGLKNGVEFGNNLDNIIIDLPNEWFTMTEQKTIVIGNEAETFETFESMAERVHELLNED